MLQSIARKLFRRLTGDKSDLREAESYLKREPFPEAEVRRRLPSFVTHKSWEVRNVGIKLIERLQDPDLYQVLLETVRAGTESGIVVRNAITAIRRLGLKTPEAEIALQRALSVRYWEARCEAIRAMAELFDYSPTRSELLINTLRPKTDADGAVCLQETNFEIRAAVAVALGGFGRPETAMPVLESLAADPHWLVRHQAAVAITELCRRHPEAVPRAARTLESIDMLSEGCRSDFLFPQTVVSLREALHNGLAQMDPAAIRAMYIDMNHGWNRKR